MRRRGVVLVLTVAAAALAAAVATQMDSGNDAATPTLADLMPSVGRVEVLNCDGTPFNIDGHIVAGSGFLIGSRVVMTAEHGMWVAQGKPACKLRVRFGAEVYHVTHVRAWGEPGQKNMYERRGVDVATLTLSRPVERRHLFAIASEGAPEGAPVSTAGYPLGGPLRVSRGTVYRNLIDYGVPAVATNLDIEGGNSGGPIFNEDGEVISIVSRIVISGSLTADKSNRSGGVDLPRWWGRHALADLCRTYGDGGIPDCGDEVGSDTTKASVVLLPRNR